MNKTKNVKEVRKKWSDLKMQAVEDFYDMFQQEVDQSQIWGHTLHWFWTLLERTPPQ